MWKCLSVCPAQWESGNAGMGFVQDDCPRLLGSSPGLESSAATLAARDTSPVIQRTTEPFSKVLSKGMRTKGLGPIPVPPRDRGEARDEKTKTKTKTKRNEPPRHY